MSFATGKEYSRTAAWRISLWSALAFAIGSAIAFLFLQRFLANDIQNRADSWLKGELGVLADVAERTPANRLHDVVVREVAELASREVPHVDDSAEAMNRAVFFLQTAPDGSLMVETGAGNGSANLAAIRNAKPDNKNPADITIPGFDVPFRVASARLPNGQVVYLALSTRYERRVLKQLRVEFAAIWCAIIVLGTGIVFVSTRRMLHRVQVISQTAALIGRGNLTSRVPMEETRDEIAHLSSTFNQMLDRVEASVQQLHAMSDSLAHDLRSPMTSMRGRLELALMSEQVTVKEDAIIASIEQLDRLSALFSTSLDVSEASADSLRLRKEPLDLDATVRSLVELYEPSFLQAGLRVMFRSRGPVWMDADSALMQRTMMNLLENSLRHVRPSSLVEISLQQSGAETVLVIEDDGAGFPVDLLPRIFKRHTRGMSSSGHGLGLAFVAAVIRSHDGTVTAANRPEGGAVIRIVLPPSSRSKRIVLQSATPMNEAVKQRY